MNTLRVCLLLALGLAVGAISDARGLPGGESRIVGGARGQWGEFPMMVAVLTRPLIGMSELVCGGSIINDNHILTSASCVEGYTALGLKAMAAGLDLLGSAGYEEFRNVQAIFIHEDYDPNTKANDLAILRTSHNFVFVAGLIEWTVLPADDSEPASGSFATTAGWGRSRYEGPVSQMLYKANGTFVNNAECASYFGSIVSPQNSCFESEIGTGVCDRDEGGPVLVDGVQVGFISRNIGCDAYPAIMTRLGPYLDWIKSHFEA